MAAMEQVVDFMETPAPLAHLIAVNSEFAVLLCGTTRCRRAQTVKGIEEHLRSFHREKPAVRKEAGEFARRLARLDVRFSRDYKGVELPVDGLAPQPIVPVIDGFSCCLCRFLTISRSVVKKHANQVHSKKGEEDERIFARVKLQSWYGAKRERYWVVNDSRSRLCKATNVYHDATSWTDKATRGLGDATRGSDDATTGFGEGRRGLGDSTTGSGEATRALIEAMRGLGDATTGSGDARNWSS